MEKPVEVQFCDGATLERHKAFFRAQSADEQLNQDVPPPRQGESWKVVAEWDAAHQVPKTGDGRKVNPPALVAWSPKGDRLFTSCDAFGLTAWDAASIGRSFQPRKLGQNVNPAAYGYPIRFFVAQRGSAVHVLQETSSYQHSYYDVYTGEAESICQGMNEHLWGWGSWASAGDGRLNRNMGISPWRPGSHQELAIVRGSSLKIVDVTKLPHRPVADQSWPLELLAWITGRKIPAASRMPVHEAPAQRWISFESLGARDKTIFGFHFHPSGEYVAVTTGDWDDAQQRRIHIVHLSSALIVASIPMTAESLGWSPGGRFLVCKRTDEVSLWDASAFEEISQPPDHLLSQPWTLKTLAAADSDVALSADGRRLLTDSATMLCSATRSGSRILRGADVTMISSQDFAHAAWHPTDPLCFVTVGGEPSSELPDTYSRDRHRPHGRLLRVWRLTNSGAT